MVFFEEFFFFGGLGGNYVDSADYLQYLQAWGVFPPSSLRSFFLQCLTEVVHLLVRLISVCFLCMLHHSFAHFRAVANGAAFLISLGVSVVGLQRG